MKNIKIILAGILFTCFISNAFSCGNEYGHTLDGRRIFTQYFFLSNRMEKFDYEEINKRLELLNNKIKNGTDDFKTWSDIAANLMKLGKVDSSIKILKPLVVKHPKEYNLLANLGTSYELIGQLDSALKYISKGLEINPNSHYGSEWIHVKILEAKIKSKNKPRWFVDNEIVSLEYLINKVDTTNLNTLNRALMKINNDFFFQIRTRAPFTPAPDKVIANLLNTLGDFNKKIGTYENALLSYIYTLDFEESDVNKFKIKEKIRQLNRERNLQEKPKEISDIFFHMMKRSEINPEYLLLGLSDFANHLDSLHLSEIKQMDSLSLLSTQLDSLKTEIFDLKKKEISESKNNDKSLLYFLISFASGLVVMFFIFKLNRYRNSNK